MTIRYSSFVVRCWSEDGKAVRVQVDYLQANETHRVASVAAAAEWIEDRAARTGSEKLTAEQAPRLGR